PDMPKVVTKGTEVLSLAYVNMFCVKFALLYLCLFRPVEEILTPRSIEYLSGRSFFGKTWSDIMMLTKQDEEETLKKVKEEQAGIDGWFKSAGQEGSFVVEEKPMFADFAVTSMFTSIRTVVGVESKVWKEIVGWQGGRWERLIE
ncbi:hypothetical protein BDQ17DRAFT_1177242, partial [Cyathus striatus]